MRRLSLAALCALSLIAAPGPAAAFQAAVLYNLGGKLDKSFNESAFRGVVAAGDSQLSVTEYEPRADAARIPMLQQAAQSADLVIAIGFAYRDSLTQAAQDNPKTHFTIIDDIIDLPNVQSVRFKEHEGAFLAGIAAAMASKSRVIGFVGGMDGALVRRFQAGYEHGARHAAPKVLVISRMIGPTIEAFADPMAGYLVATREIQDGADVVFAAVGASGLGVYQAAEDATAMAIGVDSDQNHLFPGTMLTSVVKDVGATVGRVLTDAANGAWTPGTLTIGLRENGLKLAIGRYNATLLTPDMRVAIDKAKDRIIDGSLVVEETPAPPHPRAHRYRRRFVTADRIRHLPPRPPRQDAGVSPCPNHAPE